MAYNDFPINIPGRLKSAAVGGVVADAEDIYDDALGKSQHTINSETEGRLDGQDTKIDRKLAEIDTKYEEFEERTDELFEQERIDNRNAINEATSSIRANDTIVVEDHTSVAAPEANKIYREYGETSYADWQYQNNAWVKLAEYNHGVDDEPTAGSNNLVKSGGIKNELALGAVYDVSAKNPTAGPNNDGKFESLSALLSDANLNTLIPTAVRKGGMSIKFIQSSDNKYVQFRFLLSGSFTAAQFINVANWQGVDSEPTAGSENLVESGGVVNYVNEEPRLKALYNAIKPNNQNDKFYITDANGYVIALIDSDGVHAKNITQYGEEIEKIGTKLDIIKERYDDTLYVTDLEGNVMASIDADGLAIKSVKTGAISGLDGGGIHSFFGNYELFCLGDSLSANGVWEEETAKILGMKFSQERNSHAGAQLSTGGTLSFGDGFDNGLWRAKNLIDMGYITDDGENAVVVIENVNDVTDSVPVFTKTDKVIIPTDPIDHNYQWSNWGASLLQSVPSAERTMTSVIKLLETSSGKNLAITHLPTSNGTITLTFNIGGDNLEYNIEVTTNDTLQDILDKILEYNYSGISDTLADDEQSVDFVGTITSFTLSFNGGSTGVTASITDTDSAKRARAAYFLGDSVEEDWENPEKWLLGSDMTYSTGIKSTIELLQRTYPKLHIFVGAFPRRSVNISNYKYPNGAYNQEMFVRRVLATEKALSELIGEVCEFYDIPKMNISGEWGVTASNYSTYYPAAANVHPNIEGRKKIGQTVAAIIQRNLI